MPKHYVPFPFTSLTTTVNDHVIKNVVKYEINHHKSKVNEYYETKIYNINGIFKKNELNSIR